MSENTENVKRYYVVWATYDDISCGAGLRCGILCVCDTFKAALAAAEKDARDSVIATHDCKSKKEADAKVASCMRRPDDVTISVDFGTLKTIYRIEMM